MPHVFYFVRSLEIQRVLMFTASSVWAGHHGSARRRVLWPVATVPASAGLACVLEAGR